jgi:hypothetical protein
LSEEHRARISAVMRGRRKSKEHRAAISKALRARARTNPPRRPFEHRMVKRVVPYMLDRIKDPTYPDEVLTPLERAARYWRRDVLDDLGGAAHLAATRLALLDIVVGSKMLLDSLDHYLFTLADRGPLTDRKTRAALPLVLDRMRVADGLTRQLLALGLDRQAPKALTLHEYLAARPPAAETGAEPEP